MDKEPFVPTKLTLVFILLSSMLVLMGGAAVAPALPLISEAFPGTSEATVSLIITLPSLVIAFVGFFIGSLADRFGNVKVLLASLFLFSAAGVSGFFLDSMTSILVGRAFLGLALAGIMTTTTSLIILYYHGTQRTKVLGMQSAAMGLGVLALETSGGALAGINWRMPFLIYSLGMVFLVGVVFTMKEPSRQGTAPGGSHGPQKLNGPIVLACCAGIFLIELITFLLPTKIPYLVSEMAPGSSALAGILLGAMGLISAVSGFFYWRIIGRFHQMAGIAIAFTIIGGGLVLVGTSDNMALLVVAMVICGFGMGLAMPTFANWIASAVPLSTLGKVMGVYSMCLYMGQFLSSLAAVPLYGITGSYSGLFAVMGIVSVVLAVIYLSAYRLRWAPSGTS
ncbi:MFS transporter [Methanomassiliicoccus luminyensis]|uniref:MFS transporter n=1 Tax=Methanomassiliicoccus luminyensis TaxID=1080712 RepID=UPI000366EBA7|nr:MFS transporter [Methanomassiliicoccus luminyensis]